MERFNKIFILGAGAIGSIYGAFLSRKNDVILIGEKEHVKEIKNKGLKSVGDINKIFKIKAKEKIEKIAENSLIILTTKAHQNSRVIEGIKKLIRKDTVILVLQNGLGNEKLIEKILNKKCQVLRGITMMAGEFFEPGKIKCWLGQIILPSSIIGKRIAEIMEESGLKVKLSKEMGKEIWKKLIINCLVNPLTALFKVRNYEIIVDSLKPVREKIVKECIEVANAEGIHIEKNFGKELDKKISIYKNYSAMCQDIMKGRKTEIDFLNGKIIELAKKHKIKVPVNEVIYHLIKFLEEKISLNF